MKHRQCSKHDSETNPKMLYSEKYLTLRNTESTKYTFMVIDNSSVNGLFLKLTYLN